MKLRYSDEGFAEQILKDVEINMSNLNNAFLEQAGLYAYYSCQIKLVSTELGKKKIYQDSLFAKFSRKVRQDYISTGQKPTEKMIENDVLIMPKYIEVSFGIVDLKTTESLLRDCLEALKHKKDMLIQLSVAQREEMKGSLRSFERSQSAR